MKKLALIGSLSLFLAACTSTPLTEEPKDVVVENRDVKPVVDDRRVEPIQDRDIEASGLDANGLPLILTDGKNILSKRSVYFDFDQFDVREEYQDMLLAHAKFLNENPEFKVLIQGNTDERGGREYNLALGQKRAEAVRKVLALLGVNENQVEAVSLGEEKPIATGHDEESWAENRRSDILYRNEKDQGEY